MRGLGLGLLGCCVGLTPALAGEWTVEELGAVGMYSDLAVAADGTPHVALCGARDDLGKILHATRGRGGWERVVAGALSGRAAAGQVTIALDDDGRPAILFASDAVELWRQGRQGWTQQATWATWQGNGECQLALAFADGEPVAFVYDPYKQPAIQVAVGERLKSLTLAEQAKQGGGLAVLEGKPYAVWQQETEDFDDPVVYSPQGEPPTALVANTVLRPRVAARAGVLAVLSADREGRQEVLRVHTLRDGAWSTLPGVRFDVDQGPWFALGPDGAPHVLLTEKDAESGEPFVTYAALRDGAWRSSRIQQELGTRMALQVDGQGRPHVIFADRQSERLFYATPNGELTFAQLEPAPKPETPAASGGAGEPEAGKPPRVGWGEGSGGGSSGGGSSGASGEAGASVAAGEGPGKRPAEPAATPLSGPEAEAIAAEVRQRAERWLDLREGDTLRCRDCKGSARQRCTYCRGTERIVCPACRGEKRIALPKAVGERQRYENCGTCKKKGELKCEGCEGGEQPCEGCEDTPGYRELAGTRAFWKYVAPSVRNQEDRDAFVAAVLKGERLADLVGEALSFEGPRITRVDVFSNEVVVVARVTWAGAAEESDYRTTWFREDRRFYLATGPEDREPLVDPSGAAGQPETPATPAPAPAATDRAETLLRMARNYMANGAYRAALRKLEEAAQQPLSEAQQVALDELQARCRIELDARR